MVETVKTINTLYRSEMDEVAYLLEALTQDVKLFNIVNDYLEQSGSDPLDFANLEAALEAFSLTVDRVVIVEDE